MAKPRKQAEEICVEKGATVPLDTTQCANDDDIAACTTCNQSPLDHVPGAFPDSEEDPLDRLYIDYLQKQKEIDDGLRLARQSSKEMQGELLRLREQAVGAKSREAQKIERQDEHLRQLATSKHTVVYKANGMVGPAPTNLAFGASITFLKARSGMDLYGSAVPNDSPIRSSTTSTKNFSHYDSAPGSRWRGRLSGERNCGFAGGGKSGLRRDAVNKQDEREVKKIKKTGDGCRSRFAVPTGLQEAMKKGQVINIDVKKESDGIQDGRFDDEDLEDQWLTEDDDEDVPGGKTEGLSNVKIKRRVAERVDDVIVRQVGVKKWSLDEHMRKKGNKRRG